MPSPDCPAAIRGPHGWISAARSSSSATKTTAFIGSIISDLQLGHKTYHYVAFQSLYTDPPETSTFDHPCTATCQSKFMQNHPRASRAINIALILLPPPLSESSFSDLHSWKRTGLIGCLACPHALPKFHCNVNYAPHALHAPLVAYWRHLLMSFATSTLVACLLTSPDDIIIQSVLILLTSASIDLWSGVDCWLLPRVDFLQSRCSLPSFLCRFHFCIFCFQMKNKDRISSCCNNRRRQSNKSFCNFCKHFGRSFATCYLRNKSAVSISTAIVANTESGQPMALVFA